MRRGDLGDVEALLRGRDNTYPHVQRAIDLTVQYGWMLAPDTADCPRANYAERRIYTGRIDNDRALAIFCHEGGHLEDHVVRDQGESVSYESDDGLHLRAHFQSEVWAWQFAIAHLGFRWNPAMQAACEDGLASYQRDFPDLETVDDRTAMNDIIKHGREKARGIVRLRTTFPSTQRTSRG